MVTDFGIFIFVSIVVNEKSDSCYFVGFFFSLKDFYNFLFVLSVLEFLQVMSRGGFVITMFILLGTVWAIPNSRHSCLQL